MTAKIIKVLYTKHIIGEYSLFEILERAGYKDYAIQSTIDKLTTDIESLYRSKIDKLNKRIEFQVKANDTLLLQVREMEKEILKLKEIIGVQDELIGWFGTYGQYVPYVEDLQAKITKLKQEAEIKSK